ncbi:MULTISPECIES: hypothetical protein [Marinomonas]|uniref:Lipoprotein n=1 Tax=Marinomonas alcarazii TaxID=491949 RepID=A0A318VAW3_9GAMM|nr:MULTISPECIES: hypothetical protein [Marinomonas]PYF81039.1 hypothetical protein DFP75_105129 [Marinomonas alcarazii]
MKHSALLPAVLLLSACSTNSQLNVVDGLTLVAANDGIGMNPSRWIVSGHPVQTTYVSLNGQLGLRAGQVCIASRFRSPFTNNCQDLNMDQNQAVNVSFYSEYYPSSTNNGGEKLSVLLSAIYTEREAAAAYVKASRIYYACVTEENTKIHKEQNLDTKKSTQATKEKIDNGSICVNEKNMRDATYNALSTKQIAVQKHSLVPNRVIYNWAESLKFEGGAVVLEQPKNAASGSYNKEASGYTVVNGIRIERVQINCEAIKGLIAKHNDHDRLKIVTMTLSADELYYDAREDKTAAFNANLTFSPNELKTLKNIFDSDIEASINAALASSSNIASSGYLIGKKSGNKSQETSNKGLTYYAVLTDLKSFQCPE